MFKKPTVFLLGAGASWHYGYPTGEALVGKVVAKALDFSEYCRKASSSSYSYAQPHVVSEFRVSSKGSTAHNEQWQTVAKEFENLAKRLRQVNPPVIDYFLGWNPALQTAGKMIIAWVILECEATYRRDGYNTNRHYLQPPENIDRGHDDWGRFVLYDLVSRCAKSEDLLQNDVKFITFNYDMSLEWRIQNGLENIELFKEKDIKEFMKGRVLHVYGSVRDTATAELFDLEVSQHIMNGANGVEDPLRRFQEIKYHADLAYEASKNIYCIDPHEKTSDDKTLKLAQEAFDRADLVYILGYGFDENNSARLNLEKSLRPGKTRRKEVFFTNYGDVNRVNRKASKLLFGDNVHFVPPNPSVHLNHKVSSEKSTRSTYDALSLDFDALTESTE